MTVTIYTLPSCVQCDSTKKMFTRNGVQYTEIDLQQDPDAYNMVKEMGYSAAPVVVAGDLHWSGFRPEKINSISN